MSVTIIQEITEWFPAYNDQWIVASSDNSSDPGFKYKVKTEIIYDVSGTPTTDTYYDYVVPRPDGKLVFNAKEKSKNYMSHFLKPKDYNIVECPNNKAQVSIVIYETSDSDTSDTIFNSVGYYVWNACLTNKQVHLENYDYMDYVSKTTILPHKIGAVYNRPNVKVTLKTDFFVHFLGISDVDTINYSLIDTNGVDVLFDRNMTGTVADNKIYQINISPLSAINEGWNPTVGMFIRLIFYDALLNELGTYTYEIEEICSKSEIFRIYYLNRRGGIDFFHFEEQSEHRINQVTSEVRQSPEGFIGSEWTYLPYKHEALITSTKDTYSKTLMSGWLTEQQSQDLEELFSSPLKWLVSEETDPADIFKFEPIKSLDTTYETKRHVNKKLFNYKLNIELSRNETRQRAI